jgi:formate-dependent nitrite reductase cytochrome c552 subunit
MEWKKMSLENEKSIYYTYSLKLVNLLLIALIFLIVPAGAVDLSALNNSCITCHENLTAKNVSVNYQRWSDSVHSSYFVTCDACHGGNPTVNSQAEAHSSLKNVTDPQSPIYYKNVPETCGKCHETELEHFKNTMHYQRLRAESSAPSCATCHKPHSFKVLKASELSSLCSVCHNEKDQIASANVPVEAKLALEKATELQNEIVTVTNSLSEAKAKGMDVSSAQNDLDKATSVLTNVPALWHSFNLKDFDKQIQTGIDFAKKAQNKLTEVEPTVPPTPGIGIVVVLGIIATLYIIRKR